MVILKFNIDISKLFVQNIRSISILGKVEPMAWSNAIMKKMVQQII